MMIQRFGSARRRGPVALPAVAHGFGAERRGNQRHLLLAELGHGQPTVLPVRHPGSGLGSEAGQPAQERGCLGSLRGWPTLLHLGFFCNSPPAGWITLGSSNRLIPSNVLLYRQRQRRISSRFRVFCQTRSGNVAKCLHEPSSRRKRPSRFLGRRLAQVSQLPCIACEVGMGWTQAEERCGHSDFWPVASQ